MKVNVGVPIDVNKSKTIPGINKWDINIEIFHSKKTMKFVVKYISTDKNGRETIVDNSEYQIIDNEYNQFWNFADPEFVNLGRSFKKRIIQTFKFKNWIPAEAEDEEGEV